jgi:CRP-like cAMP-binding protein
MADRLQRRAEVALTGAYRLPLVGRLLGVREIQRRLKHTPLFAQVPDGDLAEAARAAEILTLPAGRQVLRQGEVGNDLYIIASGSVYVLVNRDGAERVIDQLLTGEMFGEIAMLSGEPRTASIRTATKTTLIRLKRQTLLSLMEMHPRMGEAIWGAFGLRRFDLTAGNSTRFSALSYQQRREWFARGQLQRLAAQERARITDPWLFVLMGAVELQQDNTWSAVRAPALLQVTSTLQIVAQVPSRYVGMPWLDDQNAHAAPRSGVSDWDTSR